MQYDPSIPVDAIVLFSARGAHGDRPSIADLLEVGDCWVWTQGLDRDGYGEGWLLGRKWRIHRLVWTVLVGPIPDGLVLDHLCRVRACCNPDHLRPVTPRVNNDENSVSITALNARKESCPAGHIYDDENTGWSTRKAGGPRTNRYCKTCRRERARANYRLQEVA